MSTEVKITNNSSKYIWSAPETIASRILQVTGRPPLWPALINSVSGFKARCVRMQHFAPDLRVKIAHRIGSEKLHQRLHYNYPSFMYNLKKLPLVLDEKKYLTKVLTY